MCGTCKAWDESATDNPETGYCEWYDFNCNRKHICDAWASDSKMNKAAFDFAWDVLLKGFPANFAGNCSKCGQWFPVGTDIVPDGRGGYAHDRKCASTEFGERW
tara:strand:- start:304 stop:615 length:312 start_codon:yes stop_codon:yes gene_type:complete